MLRVLMSVRRRYTEVASLETHNPSASSFPRRCFVPAAGV